MRTIKEIIQGSQRKRHLDKTHRTLFWRPLKDHFSSRSREDEKYEVSISDQFAELQSSRLDHQSTSSAAHQDNTE